MQWIFLFLLCFFTGFTHALTPNYCKLSVEVQGLTPMANPLVEVSLSIKVAEKEKKITRERVQSLHQIAETEITSTLEALGYYHSEINGSLLPTETGFLARYEINMGPPTIVKKVNVQVVGEGADKEKIKLLVDNPSITSGMQLTHNEYETYKQQLLGQALKLGYLDAIFRVNEILINRNNRTAEINLILDTGPRYTIGQVYFDDTIYPCEYLEKFIPYPEGTPYTTNRLLNFHKILMDTDLFQHVRIDPQINEAREKDHRVPLYVRLKPKPRNRYTGSVGYGTDSGPRGMFWFEHRRRDTAGHRVNAEVRISQWKNYANLRYTIPGNRPATDRSVFAFRIIEEKFRDGKYSLRDDLSATQIKKFGKVEGMIGLHWLIRERYRELPGYPKRNAHFLIPALGLAYTNLKQKSPPQIGFRASISLRGATKPLFSTNSFAQAEARAKWVQPLILDMRLLLRAELGTTITSKFHRMPLSLRFFTGGDQTVRGYGYRSLGPQKLDRRGDLIVVGGKHLAVGSIEIERPIYKQFSGAVFFDAGQAMNSWHTRFARSVGVGIRYSTPLGPLRIDVAQALKPITQLKRMKPRFHLTFGMDI